MEPFDNLEVGGSLPFAFFCVFSRYEFALKEAGFLTSIEAEANAKADWSCFSKCVQAEYSRNQEQAFVKAVACLLDKPPKKQIVKGDGSLGFRKPTETRRDIDWVLTLVCRVRNNLFHGGKSSEREFYSERDGILMRSSLIVLNSCLDWNDQVKTYYIG
jgi:hypothetical protein